MAGSLSRVLGIVFFLGSQFQLESFGSLEAQLAYLKT